MPIHDWTRVSAGLFHHFHHGWTAALSNALNSGQLPPGYFALSEQVVSGPIADVLALQVVPSVAPSPASTSSVALVDAPPRTGFVFRSSVERYASKARRVTVRHQAGRVVAIIEIASPGNKDSRNALRSFVEKAVALLNAGVHLVVVDLFPPTVRDPQGLHKAIWDEIHDEPFELPPGKPLTLASYSAGEERAAYVEAVAVGEAIPDMPLFLEPGGHIPLGLEATYQTTWAVFPSPMKQALEGNEAH